MQERHKGDEIRNIAALLLWIHNNRIIYELHMSGVQIWSSSPWLAFLCSCTLFLRFLHVPPPCYWEAFSIWKLGYACCLCH